MTRIVLLAVLVAFGTGCGSDCPECEDTGGGGATGPDWVDADGDGVIAGVDCDDGNAAVYPGAAEGCDGVDNDCDGVSDEDGIGGAMYYADDDDDGFGDIADPVLA